MDAPRDDLTRSVPFELDRAAAEASGGKILEGYATPYDSVTRIDSWEGTFDEQMQFGAFAKTIQERTPVVQFDHGKHPMLGSIPIGPVKTLREDKGKGLFLRSPLHDNWLIEPVRDAIASGAITGMSIRFGVVNETWDKSGDVPLRTITEAKLYELGPVVFPAYADTTVGLRSLPAEVRDFLHDPQALELLARALLLGTPDSDAASGGGSDDGAADRNTPEPPAALGLTTYQRRLALINSGVIAP